MKPGLMILAALLLASCLDEKALVQKFAPKGDDEFARQFVELLRVGRYDEVNVMLDRTLAGASDRRKLEELHKIIDRGPPTGFELIGANTGFISAGTASKRDTTLTYQLQFRDTWVVVSIQIQTDATGPHVESASFQPVPDSLRVLNRFTLQNKSLIHYLFLAACILIPVFIIATIVVCVRSRVRRRWLWIIFILVAFGQFQLNWTTGEWGFRLISFLLLGAAFSRHSSYAPLMLSVGFPLGAVIFLLCQHRLRRKDEPPPLRAPPPLPSS
jgi:hypothetical protein